jgi:citrate synthase
MKKPEQLLEAVLQAHRCSAHRENASSVVLRQVFSLTLDFGKALTAALATLGGVHAPLLQTFHFLSDSKEDVEARAKEMITHGLLVPGWGNSFYRGRRDPLWVEVDDLLHAQCPELGAKLDAVTALLQHKQVYPNPSAYTVCCAMTLGLPAHQAICLFIEGRLPGWEEICFGGARGATLPTL